jgi:CHASE3 domain sensor protein
MARKVYSPEEQAKIDLVTQATRERNRLKELEIAEQEKAIRNKKYMLIGGGILVLGIAGYYIFKRR